MAVTGAPTANISEQFVREAPDIEAYKLGLMKSAQALTMPELPDYKVAAMTDQQKAAIQAGQAGIGAYVPYLQGGAENVMQGSNTIGEAADVLRGADTRNQFQAAQQAYNQAAVPASKLGDLANVAGAGMGYLSSAGQGMQTAQNMALQSTNQPGFGAAQGAVGMGIGSLAGAAQQYNPNSVNAYMNPYQQDVINNALQQINRQAGIDQTNLQAQAVKAGAFGGSREAVQRAELGRNTEQMRNQAIMSGLQSGYNTAQQQAMQAFQNQQANQLAQGQALTQAGNTMGNLASQQGTLGQNAASLYGNLAGQQAGLAGQYANVAGQQANILGQQSQLQQALGTGIGNLATNQFNIGSQMAQGLGSLGTSLGNMGVQQAALGQTAQQLAANDVNNLYNIGSMQQKQNQAVLDAQRATEMQNAMQPYQQIAFQSDIYKGAPSTQMAVTQQSAAAPSPFQQITGAGTGILGLTGAAKATGII